MRSVVVSVIASAVTSLSVLMVGLEVMAPSRAAAESSIIQARAFMVVDESGKVLASLGDVGGDGNLVIYDHGRTVRVMVSDWGFILRDEHGVTRASWSMNTAAHPLDGPTMFALYDSEGQLIARLSEDSDGLATLALRDKQGNWMQRNP